MYFPKSNILVMHFSKKYHTSNILSQKVYTSYYLDDNFHIEKINKCKHYY